MINHVKFSVLGVNVHAVDYEHVVKSIVDAAAEGRPCPVSALAVHGVMTGSQGDGREGQGIYLYGSTREVLDRFSDNLKAKYSSLVISGKEPSLFRRLREDERRQVVERIKASGARAVFVGLGCPRQEVWAFEYRDLLGIPILAVGAGFDFHAGRLPQAPRWLQDRGLEWLYRLVQEPRRLWRRYLILNPLYLWNVARQKFGLNPFMPVMRTDPKRRNPSAERILVRETACSWPGRPLRLHRHPRYHRRNVS